METYTREALSPTTAEPRLKHPEHLRQFAHFPYRGPKLPPAEVAARAWPDVLSSLASLAESEDWTGSNNNGAPNQILHNYITYTYQRLNIEQKIDITEDQTYATFNTGLLNSHYEPIFGLFKANLIEDKQKWVFLRWVPDSDWEFMTNFGEGPDMAEYVKDVGDLVYDYRNPLKLAYEHILDNIDRFPVQFRQNGLARAALDNACKLTLKRIRRNYKIAIPQWYPKLGKDGAQLLLPLDLTGNGAADLALVVSPVVVPPNVVYYRGYTVLTLEMAYAHARLVARPDSDWLRPQSASYAEDLEEGEIPASTGRWR